MVQQVRPLACVSFGMNVYLYGGWRKFLKLLLIKGNCGNCVQIRLKMCKYHLKNLVIKEDKFFVHKKLKKSLRSIERKR
jgi:hypothetical protein